MRRSDQLTPEKTVLMVVDMQEAFRDPIGNFQSIATKAATAVTGFGMLGLPVIVTEQYPQGLGPTAEEIRLSLPDDPFRIEKLTFSAFGSDEVQARLRDFGSGHVVLCGVETHVCVNQTALDLLDAGFFVHLLTDCVGSRFDHDKEAGIERMRSAGVITSSVEMALFELMKTAEHARFKEVQALIK